MVTASNLSRGQQITLAIITAVIGAFGSNFDRIFPLLRETFVSSTAIPLTGSWSGLYRDFKKDLNEQHIISETVELDEKKGTGRIRGTAHTSEWTRRKWDLEGMIYREWQEDKGLGPFITLNYRSADDRASVGSYVLERYKNGISHYKEYKGYWLGYDPDIVKIVACPYVLSSDSSKAEVMARFKDWLSQKCRFTGTTLNQ